MANIHDSFLIGAHCSIAGSLSNAIDEALSLDATTLQIFTANQRQWQAKPLSHKEIDKWNQKLHESSLKLPMSHASYLINLGCPNTETQLKSVEAMRAEIQRCLALNIPLLNFHPGAALDSPVEQCLELIIKSLLQYEKDIQGNLTLILESTAGQGSTVGHRFEDLCYIIDRVKDRIPIGVCIDTCHVFSAGYDLRDEQSLNALLNLFDQIIGLNYLKALHLNDSKYPLNSRKDRHASLGTGFIGIDTFRLIAQHPSLKNIPMYLETPEGDAKWKDEIAFMKEMRNK